MSAAPHRSGAASPDARRPAVNPWAVELRELGRRAGSMQELERTLPAPADWRVELIGVPAGAEVRLRLRLESVMEGVLVTGEVDEYVDTRLADFGATLERMLRSVEKARSTLREP